MLKINSRKNEKLLHAKKLGKNRDYRTEYGEFLCDGEKLLAEAMSYGATIVSVFTVTEPKLKLPEGTDVYQVSDELLEYISPLKNPQDVVFICKIPKPTTIDYSKGVHILLDSLQDPGNIGTILRSTVAFGIDSVIQTGECADPFNPKTVRASMGAVFKQSISSMSIQQLQELKTRIIGTENRTGATPLFEAKLNNAIIAFGNEGQGISDDLRALCSEFITIPISDNCESLNVAAAASIVMYETAKK